VSREGLVAAVLAVSRSSWIPAQRWPVDAALEQLAAHADPQGPLYRVINRWPRQRGPRRGFSGIPELVRGFVATGALTPEGADTEAGYVVSDEWTRLSRPLIVQLSERDRQAIAAAAQCLVAMSTMVSKKRVAAALAQ
jgi:hypothetical protein